MDCSCKCATSLFRGAREGKSLGINVHRLNMGGREKSHSNSKQHPIPDIPNNDSLSDQRIASNDHQRNEDVFDLDLGDIMNQHDARCVHRVNENRPNPQLESLALDDDQSGTDIFVPGNHLDDRVSEHHLQQTNPLRPFQCNLCGSSFKVKSVWKNHIRCVHQKEVKYRCNICSKGFYRSTDLTRHLRVHTGERPFQCKVCSKAFTRKCALTRHERIHSGERPYQCSKCHQRFSQSGQLRRHKKKCVADDG